MTTQPILYYISPSQVAAILPSSTPVGTGTIAIMVNGKTSAPSPITVVQSACGILTIRGDGSGDASAFDAMGNPLSYTAAVNQGEVITLWGAGLGPVSGDETVQQTPQDLTNIPIEVDISGTLPQSNIMAVPSIRGSIRLT